MPIDPAYADAIKGFEGYTPKAQRDYKQDSNGYGTRAQYPGETIDQTTAEQRFKTELSKAEAHVESVAPDAPPGVKAALTSLTYNAGPGWSKSGLGDLVRAGDWAGAAERFQQYNKAGGEVNPGLVNRRTAEAGWFGSQPALAGPQQPTTAQSVPGSFQGLPTIGAPQNNAPAGISGAQPSQAPQQAPQEQPEQPMQAQQPMMGQELPQIAGPRRPKQIQAALLQLGQMQPRFRF